MRAHGAGSPAHARRPVRELFHVRAASVRRRGCGDAGHRRSVPGARRAARERPSRGAGYGRPLVGGGYLASSVFPLGRRRLGAGRARVVPGGDGAAAGPLGRAARAVGRASHRLRIRGRLLAVRAADHGSRAVLGRGGARAAGSVAGGGRRAVRAVPAAGGQTSGERRARSAASPLRLLDFERPRRRGQPGRAAASVPGPDGHVAVVVDGVAGRCRHGGVHPGGHRVRHRRCGAYRPARREARLEPQLHPGVRAVRASRDVRVVLHVAGLGGSVVLAHAHRGFHVQGDVVLRHDDAVSVPEGRA